VFENLGQPHLLQRPKSPLSPPLAANVAEVEAITLPCDFARKSNERAGIFNTAQFLGNILLSSESVTKSDVGNARQKRAKTRHF
jgi:hypothetical protein